jgi:hypothetical protein
VSDSGSNVKGFVRHVKISNYVRTSDSCNKAVKYRGIFINLAKINVCLAAKPTIHILVITVSDHAAP